MVRQIAFFLSTSLSISRFSIGIVSLAINAHVQTKRYPFSLLSFYAHPFSLHLLTLQTSCTRIGVFSGFVSGVYLPPKKKQGRKRQVFRLLAGDLKHQVKRVWAVLYKHACRGEKTQTGRSTIKKGQTPKSSLPDSFEPKSGDTQTK